MVRRVCECLSLSLSMSLCCFSFDLCVSYRNNFAVIEQRNSVALAEVLQLMSDHNNSTALQCAFHTVMEDRLADVLID